MVDFEDIKKDFLAKKVKKEYIKEKLEEERKQQIALKESQENYFIARVIFQTVAEQTQKTIEERINSIVTNALKVVFPEDLEFKIKFIQRRNKTECDCFVLKNGNECGIFDGGFGVADIVSFGCRVAFLHIENTARKIMFLDEPAGALHGTSEQENFSDLMEIISENYGIQFIVISNQQNLHGDKIFNVKNGVVSEIK